jgi:2-methylfumaryl-CoA isomerase
MLEGLQVVEVSAFVAAPFAGTTLARMGADVIRVEQLGGGIDSRRWPVHQGRSLYRQGLDQGKRSLTVNLRSPRGQEVVTRLICDRGGILITNLGGQGWLAHEHLCQSRPDLITLLIKGTPSGRAAVDYTVNAGMGFPYITGPEGSTRPVNHVLPAWDIITGALAATSILAAEHQRRLSGRGALIELALSDVALGVARNLGLLAEAELLDTPRERCGNDIYGTYGRDFRTCDGRDVMVCALTRRQWQVLCEATGITEQISVLERTRGVDLCDEGSRFLHRQEISALIDPWVAARTLREVEEVFDMNGVLWSRYRTFKEVVAEDHEAAHFEPGPPRIGAHTEAVLIDELGFGPSEIYKLRSEGVIE